MKKILLFLSFLGPSIGYSQELITNGDFTSASISPWSVTNISDGINAWYGVGACGQTISNRYTWFGDQTESVGVDNLNEGIYQQFSIPANSSSVTLNFKVNISTLESGATPYDFLKVNLLNASGGFLQTLWNIDNSYGSYGIPGCGSWFTLTSTIPSSFYGQTVRLAFEATTDDLYSTIFRIDDVSVFASTQSTGCTYALSSSAYTCSNASANTFNNVVLVTTQNNCAWSATVLSGSNWLTTSSSGNGSGGINIIVSENTNPSPRTGIISAGGQSFTVTQPGANCTYSLTTNNYVCPNALSATLSSIALVNTQSNCSWTAVVTSGDSWMACSASGSGSGAVDIIVQENTLTTPRTGTIAIQGQTLTITQPASSGLSTGNLNGESIRIFPNPASEVIQIIGLNNADNVKIYDINGKQINLNFENSHSNLIADVSKLQPGLFLIVDGKTGMVFRLNIVR